MKNYSGAGHVNVGTRADVLILDRSRLACEVVGYDGPIEHDLSESDGTPRELMDVGQPKALGWAAHTPLREGLGPSYSWFLEVGQTRLAAANLTDARPTVGTN